MAYYKYVSTETLKKIIEKKSIRITQPRLLDDPFEMLFQKIQYDEKYDEKIDPGLKHYKEMLELILNIIPPNEISNIRSQIRGLLNQNNYIPFFDSLFGYENCV
jgi:hypothetical protein